MEEKIAILTDSTSDLTDDLIKDLPVFMLHLKIVYSDREYKDRIDISPQEIYDNFDQEIPTTSLPSIQETKDMLEEIKAQGYDKVLAINISTGLSGTSNMVRMVSEEFEGLEIEIIDSKALSMGLGNLVLHAAQLIEAGHSFSDIVTKLEAKIADINIFFVVGTLKYLKKGGRIGKVRGAIGSLLNIKPIISIDDEGVYYTHKNSRGRKRSINELFKIAKERIAEGPTKVDVIHGDCETEALELYDRLKDLDNVTDSFFGQLGPSMVVHAGPGLIAVALMKIDQTEL